MFIIVIAFGIGLTLMQLLSQFYGFILMPEGGFKIGLGLQLSFLV